ncbi:MAG: hypothetical protein WD768_01230 [Phycisphaeraceae bacterium]
MHSIRKMIGLLIVGAAGILSVAALSGCGTAQHQPFGFTIFHTPRGTPKCAVCYDTGKACSECGMAARNERAAAVSEAN